MPRNRRGFTLIEFLVALVVIGFIVALLAGLFASPVQEARTSAGASELLQDMTQDLAAKTYQISGGYYPFEDVSRAGASQRMVVYSGDDSPWAKALCQAFNARLHGTSPSADPPYIDAVSESEWGAEPVGVATRTAFCINYKNTRYNFYLAF